MNYEIVNLNQKIIVGVSAKTGNNDPEMQSKIGKLWQEFYMDGIANTVKNKVNEYSVGLYSDYTGDDYIITVGNEVAEPENSELTVKVIPAGKYAKFSVHGNMHSAVCKAWEEIWKLDLDRSFTGDFEEYLNSDMDNADIDIYVALK